MNIDDLLTDDERAQLKGSRLEQFVPTCHLGVLRVLDLLAN
jgi:hypothetical protein